MANLNWQNKKEQKNKRIKNRSKNAKFDNWQNENDDWDVDEFNKNSKSFKKNRHTTKWDEN